MNQGFVIVTYVALPPRRPTERLNDTRYYVASFELLVVSLSTLAAVFFLSTRKAPRFAAWFSTMTRFSALECLTMASPGKAFEQFQDLRARYQFSLPVAAVLTAAVVLFGASMGFLAFLVKLNQVDFVTREPVTSFSFIQWFQLLGVIYNMFCFIPESDEIKIRGILDFIDRKNIQTLAKIVEEWQDSFVTEYGFWKGVVIGVTLSAEDAEHLLNRSSHDSNEDAFEKLMAENVMSIDNLHHQIERINEDSDSESDEASEEWA